MPDLADSEVRLEWRGPFMWFGDGGPSLFTGECAETVGVYAWTVPVGDAHRVFYVGQTEAGFAARHHEHFREYFGGAYSIYEPKAFAAGRLERIYHGYAYRQPRWRHTAHFHEQVPALAEPLLAHLRVMRLFIAPMPKDRRLQRRVETALMQTVYGLVGPAGQLLERGLKLEPRFDGEAPITLRQSPVGLLEGVPELLVA